MVSTIALASASSALYPLLIVWAMDLSLNGGSMSRATGRVTPRLPYLTDGTWPTVAFPGGADTWVMQVLGPLDFIALAFFVAAWFGYALACRVAPHGRREPEQAHERLSATCG